MNNILSNTRTRHKAFYNLFSFMMGRFIMVFMGVTVGFAFGRSADGAYAKPTDELLFAVVLALILVAFFMVVSYVTGEPIPDTLTEEQEQ